MSLRTPPAAQFTSRSFAVLALALVVASCGEQPTKPRATATDGPTRLAEDYPCPTSPVPDDPASCASANGGMLGQRYAARGPQTAGAAGSYRIALLGGNLSGAATVIQAENLGTVYQVTTADLAAGRLYNHAYDVLFVGRPNTLPDGAAEMLRRVSQDGTGIVTEWQGGSAFWSERGPAVQYGTLFTSSGQLLGLLQGAVDHGDCGWLQPVGCVPVLYSNTAPQHPVMQGIAASFTIAGSEFCFRVQNPDASLQTVATARESNGTTRPMILAGPFGGAHIVLWMCDWGDAGSTLNSDQNGRRFVINAVQYAASAANHAPVASAGAPQAGTEGSEVTFDASASADVDGDVLTYAWDFGDGSTSTAGPVATHSYADNRDTPYTVTLTVTDTKGASATATTTAMVANVAPTAVAGYVDASGSGDPKVATIRSGGTLDFSGSFDDVGTLDAPWQWSIDWGDGSNATTGAAASLDDRSIHATHSYPSGLAHGTTFTARLTVTDKDHGESSDAITVSITNSAPVITLGSPTYVVNEGSPVTLAATATDAEGDAITYAWTGAPGAFTGADTPTPSVLFDDDGAYTVQVSATDALGNAAVATVQVEVRNVAPTAAAHVDAGTIDEGGSFHVSLTDIADPSAADRAQLQFAFDCGEGFGVWGSLPMATCTTDDNGTRSVSAKVRDDDGGENVYALGPVVTVLNVAPTATFTNDGPVAEGGAFTLSLVGAHDVSSRDAASGFTYAFDCGGGYGGTSSSASASCAAPDNAVRAVRATIFDKDGGATEYASTVRVDNVAPLVRAGLGATIVSGQSFAFAGSFSDPGAGDAPWSYRIDWSDGTPTVDQTSSQSAITGSHRYLRAGSYTVSLSVTDKDGGAGVGTTVVQVDRLPVGVDIFPYASTLQNTVLYNTVAPLKSTPVVIALLGSTDFPAVDPVSKAIRVDLASLRLGRTSLARLPIVPPGTPYNGYVVAVGDVNRDGILDALLTFRLDQLVANGDLSAALTTPQTLTLVGDHADGRQFSGSDNVRVIPVTTVSAGDDR